MALPTALVSAWSRLNATRTWESSWRALKPATRDVIATRRWAAHGSGSGKIGSAAAFVLFLAVSVLFFGRQALGDMSHVCSCTGSPDSAAYMWNFEWWPHALIHAINPFLTLVIWVPDGINLANAASVQALSLLVSPVTALFGPIVAYNVLNLLAPALAGWFAFRLCRYLCGKWLPSVIGGYVFGFSSYQVAQMTSHLNLVVIFLVPAAAQLVLERLDARISPRRIQMWLTPELLLLLGSSTEILLTLLMGGALALVLGYTLAPARRADISGIFAPMGLALVATVVLASPYLYYSLKGLGPNPTANWAQVELCKSDVAHPNRPRAVHLTGR